MLSPALLVLFAALCSLLWRRAALHGEARRRKAVSHWKMSQKGEPQTLSVISVVSPQSKWRESCRFTHFVPIAWVLAGVLAVAPTPTSGAHQAWEQQTVTELASQLAQAVSGVYEEFRKQPPMGVSWMQSRAHYRLQDELRLLERETHELEIQLKSGEGRDATQPIYDRIGALARHARIEARNQFVAESVQKRVDRAEELWSRLTPYYASSPARIEKNS